MTISVELSIDDQLGPALKKIIGKLPEELPKALLRAAQHAEGEVRREIMTTNKGGPGRTGALARSFQASLIKHKNSIAGAAVSDLEYAAMQNYGGTIRPRSAGALSVPIADEAHGRGPRSFSDLQYIKRKGKDPLLVRPQGDGFKLMYVLKQSVTLRPRGFIEKAQKAAEPGIQQIMSDTVDVTIKGAED